jgi:glycerol-3-phosphate acyltransferase PlsY
MNYYLEIISAIVSYLLGSISFARIVTYIWTSGKDITDHEIPVDGTNESYKVLSIGANSVSSLLGAKVGTIVSIFDILKVFLPTLFFKLSYPEQPALHLIAATFGVIGHIWPIYYRFHGGSGFTAIMGGLFVIDWTAIFITSFVGLFLGMVVFRNMVVATLSWIWLLIPWLWWRTNGSWEHVLYGIAINVLFMLAMIPEIQNVMTYREKGKTFEYAMGNLKSNPMGRGMLKMAKFFKVEIK